MTSANKADAPQSEEIQVGAFFLETLTTGMYEDPFHCIREYVQNGFDAIQDAIRENVIKEDEGRLLISVERSTRGASLVITDNGTGVPAEKAYSTFVSLGASRKTPAYHAGFRGIGRLAGIAYCTTLRFTTKARGEKVATVVEFDCGLVRGHFFPGADPLDVRELVRKAATRSTIAEDEGEHFTKVEMLYLVNVGAEFVDWPRLEAYLQQVCPVEYSDSFDYAEQIRSAAAGFGEKLKTVDIQLRQKKERISIHKPYKNQYPTGRKNVVSTLHDIVTFTSKAHGWFGWIGASDFPGEIVDPKTCGVRFRVKNIQIGGSEIIEMLAEELTLAGSDRRLQPWAVGEIFVTNNQIVPNARRDGFEDSEAWRDIRKDIKEQVVKRIIKMVRGASTTRSALKVIGDALTNLTKRLNVEKLTSAEKARLEAELRRHLLTIEPGPRRSNAKEKFPGADPKELSRLVSAFKGLQERLSQIEVGEPASEKNATNDTASEGAGTDEAASDAAGADDQEEEPEGLALDDSLSGSDVLTATQEILTEEFGATDAGRLIKLIVLRASKK